MSATINHL